MEHRGDWVGLVEAHAELRCKYIYNAKYENPKPEKNCENVYTE